MVERGSVLAVTKALFLVANSFKTCEAGAYGKGLPRFH